MPVSAVMIVYNEEARIEATIRCATWCDEIVVLDKQSTDRTREIASKYTSEVYETPYSQFDTDELQRIVNLAKCEWILWLTASDVLSPALGAQLRELTDRVDLPYDVIHVPYRRYVLGLESRRSPWYSGLHPAVFRKRVVVIRPDDVHGAIAFNTERHYRMTDSADCCMYHLTHETVDSMMERHLRYCRAEGRLSRRKLPLRKGAYAVLRSAYDVVFKRKTWLMGWDGIALAMAFMTYWMLRFVYIWERRRSNAAETYRLIRRAMSQAWVEEANRRKNHVRA